MIRQLQLFHLLLQLLLGGPSPVDVQLNLWKAGHQPLHGIDGQVQALVSIQGPRIDQDEPVIRSGSGSRRKQLEIHVVHQRRHLVRRCRSFHDHFLPDVIRNDHMIRKPAGPFLHPPEECDRPRPALRPKLRLIELRKNVVNVQDDAGAAPLEHRSRENEKIRHVMHMQQIPSATRLGPAQMDQRLPEKTAQPPRLQPAGRPFIRTLHQPHDLHAVQGFASLIAKLLLVPDAQRLHPVAPARQRFRIPPDPVVRFVIAVGNHHHLSRRPRLSRSKRPAEPGHLSRQGRPEPAGVFRSHMLQKIAVQPNRILVSTRSPPRPGHVIGPAGQRSHRSPPRQPAKFRLPVPYVPLPADHKQVIRPRQRIRQLQKPVVTQISPASAVVRTGTTQRIRLRIGSRHPEGKHRLHPAPLGPQRTGILRRAVVVDLQCMQPVQRAPARLAPHPGRPPLRQTPVDRLRLRFQGCAGPDRLQAHPDLKSVPAQPLQQFHRNGVHPVHREIKRGTKSEFHLHLRQPPAPIQPLAPRHFMRKDHGKLPAVGPPGPAVGRLPHQFIFQTVLEVGAPSGAGPRPAQGQPPSQRQHPFKGVIHWFELEAAEKRGNHRRLAGRQHQTCSREFAFPKQHRPRSRPSLATWQRRPSQERREIVRRPGPLALGVALNCWPPPGTPQFPLLPQTCCCPSNHRSPSVDRESLQSCSKPGSQCCPPPRRCIPAMSSPRAGLC